MLIKDSIGDNCNQFLNVLPKVTFVLPNSLLKVCYQWNMNHMTCHHHINQTSSYSLQCQTPQTNHEFRFCRSFDLHWMHHKKDVCFLCYVLNVILAVILSTLGDYRSLLELVMWLKPQGLKLTTRPCQDAPFPHSLEWELGRTGGHVDRSWDVQDTCLHSMNNFC